MGSLDAYILGIDGAADGGLGCYEAYFDGVEATLATPSGYTGIATNGTLVLGRAFEFGSDEYVMGWYQTATTGGNPVAVLFRGMYPRVWDQNVNPGLAAWLVGIEERRHIATHPLRRALFENLVVTELVKSRYSRVARSARPLRSTDVTISVTLCILLFLQAIAYLRDELMRLASADRYLFSSSDLRALDPDHGDEAFRALLTRATRSSVLRRVYRGIYIFPYVTYSRGYELYHAAARLRAVGRSLDLVNREVLDDAL